MVLMQGRNPSRMLEDKKPEWNKGWSVPSEEKKVGIFISALKPKQYNGGAKTFEKLLGFPCLISH